MKQVEVTILGQSYLLACPEGGEQRLLAAVSTVDQEMSAIRDAGKVKARERMAVLAALNLAYRLTEPLEGRGAAAAPSGSGPAGRDGAQDKALADHPDVAALVARLDAALGQDGQLL